MPKKGGGKAKAGSAGKKGKKLECCSNSVGRNASSILEYVNVLSIHK